MPPKLQHFIDDFAPEKEGLQGGAVAILYEGKPVYKATFGHQQNSSKPITEHTIFPIASVSKSVTATAIALLADKGLIDLDKKVHINALKRDLSHTTSYSFRGDSEIEQGLARSAIMQKIALQKPACKVGECYFYSNAIYSLADEALHAQGYSLALAIENLQKTLRVHEIELLPLQDQDNFAYPHRVDKSGIAKALPFPPYYPKAAPASAGIFASLDGIAKAL